MVAVTNSKLSQNGCDDGEQYVKRARSIQHGLTKYRCRLNHRLHLWCDEYNTVRPWAEWHVKNTGTIHAWIRCHFWVRAIYFNQHIRMAYLESSFFMSIGTTIRTESSPILTEAFRKAQARHGRPMIMPLERIKRAREDGRRM